MTGPLQSSPRLPKRDTLRCEGNSRPRNTRIVALARSLLIALWRFAALGETRARRVQAAWRDKTQVGKQHTLPRAA